MSDQRLLAAALGYAGAGIHVFPVRGKAPLTEHGFYDASTDREQIEAWWQRWPDAGIATPDFDVVDVDLYKSEAAPTWTQIRPLIPNGTPQTRTGGGGLQFYFAAETLKDGKIGPGVDSRYAGRNYVILPPSPHPDGGRYEAVVELRGHALKPAPEFPHVSGSNSEFQHLREQMVAGEKIRDGRNKAAWWRAVAILRSMTGAIDVAAVEQLVQAWVDLNCEGDLREVDVPKQVRGAVKFVANERAEQPPPIEDEPSGEDLYDVLAGVTQARKSPEAPEPGEQVRPAPRLQLRSLASYEVRRLRWLEKPFWQAGAFHLLAGRKGSCKGTYLARHAARVTNGDLYGTPKRVLVLTSEDSIELDFKPRVLAAGGNPELIEIVVGPFQLPDDIPWIKTQAVERGDVGLIVLDPLGNHTGGRNTDQEGPIREAIQDLNPLADELDCMVAGVRHLGKDTSRGALASVLGSTAFVDVPRCVILLAADDEDDFLFHAQVVAGNRGPRSSAGRAFRLELVDVPPAEEITLLVPAGASSKDVEDLLGVKATKTEGSKTGQARELILDILEGEGEQESDALDARVASETGLTAKTVQNTRSGLAKEGLIKSYPDKDEYFEVVCWKVSPNGGAAMTIGICRARAREHSLYRYLDYLSQIGRDLVSAFSSHIPTAQVYARAREVTP